MRHKNRLTRCPSFTISSCWPRKEASLYGVVRTSRHWRGICQPGFRRRKRDLLVLSRWHPDVVEKMGEQSGPQQEVIGLDQLRSLDRLLSSIEKAHPHVTEKKGGTLEVSNLLGQGFYNQRFADGMRSQEGIRKATKAVKTIAGDHPAVEEFLSGDIGLRALIRQSEERLKEKEASNDKVVTIIEACQTLASLLIQVDANSLSEAETKALERTHRVLESVISS